MLTVNNRDDLRKLRGDKEVPKVAPVPTAAVSAPAPPQFDMGSILSHMQATLHLQAENLARTTGLLAASMEAKPARQLEASVQRDSSGRMERVVIRVVDGGK